MAIFKPTDCSPFNGTFDLTNENDLPIILECKIDTSNTKVTAYTIELYDSNNNKIFPQNDDIILENRMSYVPDLKEYMAKKFPRYNKYNINSGINGTYIDIPFVVLQKDIDVDNKSTVKRNQLSNQNNILKNGESYFWKIILYQEVKKEIKNGMGTTTVPNELKYYDMTVAAGTVLGSNEERIQTAAIDSSENTVENLVLLDKFIQPVFINNLDFDIENPVEWRGNTGSIILSGPRNIITTYDSAYGHIYPSKATGNTFQVGQITPEVSNGFRIYEAGNNPDNIKTSDKIDFIYSGDIHDGEVNERTWEWIPQTANPSNSYWVETYESTTKPSSPYYPFGDSTYSIIGDGAERIAFNNVQKEAFMADGSSYQGSPYNGVFYPIVEVSEIKKKNDKGEETKEIEKYKITIYWRRPNDCNTWGLISNKILYLKTGENSRSNFEVATTAKYGVINKTPILFVEEKPIKIFNSSNELITETNETIGVNVVILGSGASAVITLTQKISAIKSFKYNNNYISDGNYSYEVGGKYIYYTPDGTIPSSEPPDIEVIYYPYKEQDYTGVIFYNNYNDNQNLYIRPSSNIKKDMMYKELDGDRYFKIKSHNSLYNYIIYDTILPTGSSENFETNKSRYQIKSFFTEGDLNPLYLYLDPALDLEIYTSIDMSGTPISPISQIYTINGRNFTAYINYEQNSYISWKSFQWFLLDSFGLKMLEQSDEIYDGEIKHTFYGLENNTDYVLSLVLQTNTNKIIRKNYEIRTSFIEGVPEGEVVAEFDCDTLSMKAELTTKETVIVPHAEGYIDKAPVVGDSWDSVYIYNSESGFYYKKNEDGNYDSIAEITTNNNNGTLSIKNGESLDFKNVFESGIDINENTAIANIQSDSDIITIEGSFKFSNNLLGNIFKIGTLEDGFNNSIIIPEFLEFTNLDEVLVSNNASKFVDQNGIGVKFIYSDGTITEKWQSIKYFQISSFQREADANIGGNTGNVAPFTYADVLSDDGETLKEDKKYRNVNGMANSYNGPLISFQTSSKESFGFTTNDGETFICKEKDTDEVANLLFKLNATSRILWTDYVPEKEMENVVIRSTNSDPEGIFKSVLSDTSIMWSDEFIWKDGEYLMDGSFVSATLGEVYVNNSLVETIKVEGSPDEGEKYSQTNLTPLIELDNKFPERENIENKTFVFKILFNTRNFSIIQSQSFCYVR